MKIDVTYEKSDILRLVLEDLKRRQIKVKEGFKPEYKGALSVKLSIEADDEDAPESVERPAAEATSRGDGEAPPQEPEVDMDTVLQQSRRVASTTKPSFRTAENGEPLKRQLGPNESLDFPREE